MPQPAKTQMMTAISPFAIETPCTLVALKQPRKGYLQLSTREPFDQYAGMPDHLLRSARAWAIQLEALGSPRVYWIVLSEVVTHYHIHLFPRWPEDTCGEPAKKGIPLFEARDAEPQPPWTDEVEQALANWAVQYDVAVTEL